MTDTIEKNNEEKKQEKRPMEEEAEKETKIPKLDDEKEEDELSNTDSDTSQKEGEPAILNIANAPPPPGMHLLSESQQQQIIQHYVQAQGHDLANFTASSLAQAMVAPIQVPNLTSNLLQFQNGAVITALPGPPHPIPPTDENKRQNTRNMSNDERRQRRLLRNRQAAKECRKKKKQHIHEMEEKIVHLEQQNALLVKELDELKNKLTIAAMQGTEGYRLMKEVEELNAKLGMTSLPIQSGSDPKESEGKKSCDLKEENPDNQHNTETDQATQDCT
ncbi:hypothetical protein G6F56_005555 [Rhizopus delemar]|uniref:BZIP domain-containing protein n=1 Tax=Rhizopus stolonifer TaxID=4846 RepID=A0A367IIE6_RHIST|nr:hypothetical protein G6F56_005555 [Rhizopus delemar]RCH77472.1 hypothetical protein CU098_003810 [Rhizopus stolonifer]